MEESSSLNVNHSLSLSDQQLTDNQQPICSSSIATISATDKMPDQYPILPATDQNETHGDVPSKNLTIPLVGHDQKPCIGMEFKSLEDVQTFYADYGKSGGFDTRNGSSRRSNDGEITGKYFLCAKAGESIDRSKGSRGHGTTRCNCNAMIWVVLNRPENKWVVRKFVEEHNHEVVTPRRMHLLRGNRTVDKAKKRLLMEFKEASISTNQAVSFMEGASGGFNKLGCTERDIRNYERNIKEALKGHDAQMLLDYFNYSKEKNPSFYYAYKLDEDKKLTHCFWRDSTSRINFHHFGDVVTFDTTHNTNQYKMIWAPFVGINHHRQTIFLSCSFIPDETADSFTWVFERFIDAMGRAPDAIITDQDLGMKVALSRVFPHTRHRLCIWHILNKVQDKLGAWASKEKFMIPFKNCIWQSKTPNDFENKWNSILEENSLTTHEWLNLIFAMREKWIPTYHKSYFWAGISSSQRSEVMNNLIKMKVSGKNTLHDFATIFKRALGRQRHQELQEDHMTIEKKPKLKTKWGMELQMSKIYTRTNFRIFQEELEKSLLNNVNLIEENELEIIYVVALCGDPQNSEKVTYSKQTDKATCGCLMFEFEGIPCHHVLAYLKNKYVNNLPLEYIKHRWTRDIKRGVMTDIEGNTIGNDTAMNYSSRLVELNQLSNKLIDEALNSDTNYHVVKMKMQEALNVIKVTKTSQCSEVEGNVEHMKINERTNSQVEVYDPDEARIKGRKRGTRWKAGRENMKKRNRRCNYCEKRGQDHDYRNCPDRKKSLGKSVEEEDMQDEDEFDEDEFDEEE